MKRFNAKGLIVFMIAGCFSTGSFMGTVEAREEAKMYAITTWNGGCGGSTRGWWDNMADAWLDNMYRPNISGSDDQCPVAYAVGRNSTDTWSRIGSERYNQVHSDPTTIGYWGVVFISGCDPAAETVINSDTSS